ncbi:hypothetical protein NIIDMKKI_49910 [Mycobacterium kansasii]|uniref:Uncharacterized protein n=1 Tax=Mycobacterium kansasii TaxID=1768 RepID=A0A7G1IJ97_MYCKA|nr:hypothetical protein NIIDMKKI_49910 [Mycobacterium kansasii]
MAIDIARLGRRPGAMFSVQDTVDSPTRIGVELIAIQGCAAGPGPAGGIGFGGSVGHRDGYRPHYRGVLSLPDRN